MISYQHYYTIEGRSGDISSGEGEEVIKNAKETYIETIIINDSENTPIEGYVNTDDNPFILFPKEKLEFEFTVTTIILKNISATESASYRVFLKRRVREHVA